MAKAKKPNTGPRPLASKKLPAGQRPSDHPDDYPVWRFRYLDHHFPEATGWKVIDGEAMATIVEAVSHIEQKPMKQLYQGPSGSKGGVTRYRADELENGLAKEARRRLVQRELELDHLVRIRVQWAKRLYAFQGESNVLNLLWWDPEHEIYPGER